MMVLPIGNSSLVQPHCVGVLKQEGTCPIGAARCMLFGLQTSVVKTICGRGKMGPWMNVLFAQRKRIVVLLPTGNSSLVQPHCVGVLKQEGACAIGAAHCMLFGSQTIL